MSLVLLSPLVKPDSSLLLAQSESASVSGRVTDPQNLAMPDSDVEIKNVDTGLSYTTKTNSDGFYSFPSLPPGNYLMNVRKLQFRSVSVTGITLHVQDSVSRNFELQVGSSDVSITVTADQNNINTTDASVSTVIDRKFVENMPLNGRSFQSLIRLTPGVVTTASSFGEPGQFSVNGQRPDANYFSVDGVSANVGVSPGNAFGQQAAGAISGASSLGGTNNLVSVDALEEFRIQTSTFAPEFGRTPGAQIQVLTRSGTNTFHGNVFDYFRNDVLDARDWFARPPLRKPPNRQNDFGGVLGGPIFQDKTFFFFSYEGLRLRQPGVKTSNVPSLLTRTNAAPAIQPIVNAFPLPTGQVFANGLAEYQASFSDPSNLDATSIRVDQILGTKLTLFGRYNHAPSQTTVHGLFSDPANEVSTTNVNTDTLTLGMTWAISPSSSNEFRFNYSKAEATNHTMLTNLGGAVVPPDSLFFPTPFSSKNALAGVFLFNGAAGFFNGSNVHNLQRQFNFVDNHSIAHGAHALKFGVDFRRLAPTFNPRQYDQIVRFNSLSSLNNGSADSVLIESNSAVDFFFHNFSLYGQDTWKATRRLTLTYGLRWDINPAPTGNPQPFAVTNFNNLSALALASRGTALYNTTYGNVAPRLGVAYQLVQSPGHETVLRGGFGMFYDLGSSSVGGQIGTGSFPYGASRSLSKVAYPLTSAQAAPPAIVTAPPISRIATVDPNLQLPRVFQWNFAVEQSLGANRTLSTTYVGAVGRRLEELGAVLGANADFPGFTTFLTNGGSSDYHSLQLQFQQRLSRGLQTLATYTWSHSMDTASSDNASGTNLLLPGLNPNVNRGASDFDVRNSFNLALTYNIPAPDLGVFSKALLRGWAIDTIVGARSALPVDLRASSIIFSSGQLFFTSIRPDLVAGVPVYLSDATLAGGRRLNPAAFVVPPGPPVAPLRQGTLGRNVLRGFGFTQVDFALRREFSLTERVKLQLRAEAFNLFNHPNFANPISRLSDPNFGKSIQTLANGLGGVGGNAGPGGFNPLYQIGGPRSGQLALKVLF